MGLSTEVERQDGEIVISFEEWPRDLISIYEWGCAIQICLDCKSGALYRVEPSRMGYHITREAATLEDWLYTWMRNELYSKQPQKV